jgi:hypothetical protein
VSYWLAGSWTWRRGVFAAEQRVSDPGAAVRDGEAPARSGRQFARYNRRHFPRHGLKITRCSSPSLVDLARRPFTIALLVNGNNANDPWGSTDAPDARHTSPPSVTIAGHPEDVGRSTRVQSAGCRTLRRTDTKR